MFWLEDMQATELLLDAAVDNLRDEANELVAIFTAFTKDRPCKLLDRTERAVLEATEDLLNFDCRLLIAELVDTVIAQSSRMSSHQ